MTEDISIGYWLKRRRKSLDLTQKELANRVGCALITIAKLEADERKPSRETAVLLAKQLQIPNEQVNLFISILRGEKSSSQLSKIAISGLTQTNETVSLEDESLRGIALVQRISRGKLVGRRVEMVTALNELASAASGESRTLILQGEPGIGKSRLAFEVIREAKGQNTTTLVGECFTGGERPYAPFARMIQTLHEFPAQLPTPVIADLKVIAPQLETLFPNIPPNPKLEPLAEQMRLFESVYLLFSLLAKDAPLLILVEDIHWADHGSLEMLKSLARRFRQTGLRALMILTTREEIPPESFDLPALFDDLLRAHLSTFVHLNRFTLEETSELLTSIFAQEITSEFIELIHRETQGNPFFIEEVCKELIENGTIYWLNDRWERKEITEIQAPKSVQNAIQARLTKLSKDTRDTLLMAAILGRRFDFDLLRAATGRSEEDLIDTLETAKNSQLINDIDTVSGGTFEFSHNLIASVLRESASAPRRILMHKQAIEALEKIHPNEYGLLAYHCRETGDAVRALSYFQQAADRALRMFAHEDATRFYSEALLLAKENDLEACRILLACGKVYDLRGHLDLRAQNLEQIRKRASGVKDTGLHAEIELAFAEYSNMMSDYASVIEHSKRSIELAQPVKRADIQAQAYMLWGRALTDTGELQEASQQLRMAGELGREAGLRLIEARSLINLGNVDYRLGDFESARQKYIEALTPVREMGERRIECMTINNLGNIVWMKGNLDEAIELYSQTLAIAREIGDRLNEARALSNLGSIFTEQFKPMEAIQYLEEALTLIRNVGQRADEVVVLTHLGDVMESLGQYEEALIHKENALHIAREIEDTQSEAETLTGISRINLFLEENAKAEQLARDTITIAQNPGLHAEEAEAWNVLGRACLAQHKTDDAIQAFSTALGLYQNMKMDQKCTEMQSELARLAEMTNDHAQALQHLQSVLPERAMAGAISDPTVCLCCFLVLRKDDPESASTLLENGHNTLQTTLAKITNANTREHYLKAIPNHKQLAELWIEAHKLDSSKGGQ